MSLKEIYELGINELSKEPSHMYKVITELSDAIIRNNAGKQEILEILFKFDVYAYEFLNKEEYYALISSFPKLELLKSDHIYYKASFYRLRYHFTYFDLDIRKFSNINIYGLHLAANLKEWLDFNQNVLGQELIEHLKGELFKLNAI